MITLPAPGRLPYAPLQLCCRKNTSLTFHTHPVLGGCQNNSTIGTSPDPLSPREGLACETMHCLRTASPMSRTSLGTQAFPVYAVRYITRMRAHVILRLRVARARNNWIPKRIHTYMYIHTNYFRDTTQNYLPRAKALSNQLQLDHIIACNI